MHHHYNDITDRIGSKPKWWDEHAVPRYCDFHPDQTANIYANEVVLLLIACQDCGHEFPVCMSQSRGEMAMRAYNILVEKHMRKPTDEEFSGQMERWSLASQIETDTIHYGDPPNACPPSCCAGSTMNSIPLRVLQYWRHKKGGGMPAWERVENLERVIDCEWANDPGD